MVSCSAYHGVYMTKEVSVIFLYPSKHDGWPHKNCSLTRVIYARSTFLSNQHQNENVTERFYID